MEYMGRGQWGTEMSSTCRSADTQVVGLRTIMPVPFALSVLKKDQRREFPPLIVCFFFRRLLPTLLPPPN